MKNSDKTSAELFHTPGLFYLHKDLPRTAAQAENAKNILRMIDCIFIEHNFVQLNV